MSLSINDPARMNDFELGVKAGIYNGACEVLLTILREMDKVKTYAVDRDYIVMFRDKVLVERDILNNEFDKRAIEREVING